MTGCRRTAVVTPQSLASAALVGFGLCLLFSSCADALVRKAASFALGGATSFEEIAPALLNGPCKSAAKGQVYQSVGSGAGIDNFNGGVYVAALSDSPMTTLQEKKGISATGKLTLPLILSKYSFFVGGKPDGLKMTAAETYAMFKSGKAAKAGKFTPLSRSDSSGTTFVVKRYWKVAKTGFLADIARDSSLYSSDPFPKSWAAAAHTGKKSDGVCKGCKPGFITYSQVGVCNKIAPGTTGEVLLPNKAGLYIKASNADASQAIPRTLPARQLSYAGVSEQTILQKGPQTPAIVSFIYGFIRTKNLAAAGPNGPIGKALLTCINANINSFAQAYQFDNTPAKITSVNAAALATVK